MGDFENLKSHLICLILHVWNVKHTVIISAMLVSYIENNVYDKFKTKFDTQLSVSHTTPLSMYARSKLNEKYCNLYE